MQSKIEGTPDISIRSDNEHWIWTGSRYRNREPYLKYQQQIYLPAVCLAAYPRMPLGGHVLSCSRALCVNPNHCVVSVPYYSDMDVLFIHGPKMFPDITPEEVARYLYNPDDDIWAHRVRKALRASHSVVDALLPTVSI